MNLVTVLYILISNFIYADDSATTKVRSILVNDFWGPNGRKINSDKGSLCEVRIGLEQIYNHCTTTGMSPQECIYDNVKKEYYPFFSSKMTPKLFEGLKPLYKNKLFIKIEYVFDKGPPNASSKYTPTGNKVIYTTYKAMEKSDVDEITLKNEGYDACLFNLKKILQKFMKSSPLKIDKHSSNMDEKDLQKIVDFEFYYFKKSSSECLAAIKGFVKTFKYFTLKSNLSYNSDQSDSVFIIQEFVKHFNKFYDENFGCKSKNPRSDETKRFYGMCHSYLLSGLMNGDVFLPISEAFDIDTHLEKLTSLINEATERFDVLGSGFVRIDQMTFDSDQFLGHFKKKVTDYQDSVVFKVFKEEECSYEYLKNLFDKEFENLEDYKELEAVICDFHNLLVCLVNSKKDKSDKPSYAAPIYVDSHKCKIVKAFEITVNHLAGYDKIKAFDSNGEEISLVRDIDFYKRTNIMKPKNDDVNDVDDVDDVFSVPLHVIRNKKIQVVEIIAKGEGKRGKRFNVSAAISSSKK